MNVSSELRKWKKSAGIALLSLTALLAGCEQEVIRVVTPELSPAVYSMKGTITDANTQQPLQGVTVAGGGGSAVTAADGTFSMGTTSGSHILQLTKEGYETLPVTVNVAPVADGEVSVSTVYAALKKATPAPTYKQVKYAIKGEAIDEATGLAVPITSATYNRTAFTLSGSSFSADDVTAGTTYLIVVTAEGYYNGYASQTIESKKIEGSSDQVETVTTNISVPMQKKPIEEPGTPEPPAAQPKYYVMGTVTDANNAPIYQADFTVMVNNKEVGTAKSNAKGVFELEIPAGNVTPLSVITVTAEHPLYKNDQKTLIPQWVVTGETSVTAFSFTLQLISEDNKPEQGNQYEVGGSAKVEVPLETAQAVDDAEELLTDDAKLTEVIGADVTEEEKAEAKELIEAAVAELVSAGEPVKLIVVPVKEEVAIPLVSKESAVDETGAVSNTEVVEVKDEIKVQAGGAIIYPNGVAKALTVDRIIADEKATASTREYEGQPDGTIFTKPLQISFPTPAITIAPESTATGTGTSPAPGTTEPTATPTVVTDNSVPEYSLPLLYEQKDGSWKQEEGKFAVYNEATGKFEGGVSHFSRFRFGYQTTIKENGATNDTTTYEKKQYYTGEEPVTVIFKGKYNGGVAYDGNTPVQAVQAKLKGAGQATVYYLASLLQDLVKADNYNVLPKAGYEKKTFEHTEAIASFQQIEGFTIKTTETKKTYTLVAYTNKFEPVTISVTVKRVISATMKVIYSQSHGGGHGSHLSPNAGGGVFDIE